MSNVSYAKGFSIVNESGTRVLKIFHGDEVLNYQFGGNADSGSSGEDVTFSKPITRVATLSTTYAGALVLLDRRDVLVGTAYPDFIFDSLVGSAYRDGEIANLGALGQLDFEELARIQPDVLIVGADALQQPHLIDRFTDLSIQPVLNIDYLEQTPLGRAEWIKFYGFLLNAEEQADSFFSAVEKRYLSERSRSKAISERPLVLCNLPYKGSWFVPGGQSFVANLIADAGGTYPWAAVDRINSIPVDIESVISKALEADVWINPSSARHLEEMRAILPEVSSFKAYRTAQVYNNNKRNTAAGGSDYWETGPYRPDLVLGDLIAIFSGSTEPDSLYYMQRLE